MRRSTAEIVREYGPFSGVDHVHGVTYDGRARLVCGRRHAERLRPCDRKAVAVDRCRRPCRHGLRRPASVSARRGSHPEDRPDDRPCARHDTRARGRRRLGAHVGRRHALGGPIPGPEDPSDRSATPGRFFAPSSPTASSPGSPGSTESSGTAPGKVTRAICGESILEPERCWSGSRCRLEWACQGSSPTAAISSSAAGARAERCGPSADHSRFAPARNVSPSQSCSLRRWTSLFLSIAGVCSTRPTTGEKQEGLWP